MPKNSSSSDPPPPVEPVAASTPSPAHTRRQSPDFVAWLREVAPHIHAHVGKVFVVAIPGELIAAEYHYALINDLALLHAIGIRLVLVHGARPQVNEQLALRGMKPLFANTPADYRDNQPPLQRGHGITHGITRITDKAALECLKEAAGEIRLDLEALFSQGLPNTPMAHASVRVVSGNFITARPLGIVRGINFLHTGVVRKVAIDAIKTTLNGGAGNGINSSAASNLDSRAIVLLSPLGFSPTGEAFNLAMEDIASQVAVGLRAHKLIFMADSLCLHEQLPPDLSLSQLSELTAQYAKHRAANAKQDTASPSGEQHPQYPLEICLPYAAYACQNHVPRVHLVPFRVDGSLLVDLFTHDGLGTMISHEHLESLREATLDDIGGILALTEPLVESGILAARDRTDFELHIASFSVIAHDGRIFGCAALFDYPQDNMAEMACVAVDEAARNQGDGTRLLQRIESRAKQLKRKRLFVLTTHAMHWFLKHGFYLASKEDLPPSRQANYNWQRQSQIYIKNLD